MANLLAYSFIKLLSFIVACVCFRYASAGRFLAAAQVPAGDVERAMLADLAGSFKRADGRSRLDDIEDYLRPMFAALPKDQHGGLGHKTVRYTLHRLFMQRRSWYIRGLDPSNDKNGKPVTSMSLALDSLPVLPSLLQASLERRHAGAGLSLRETAALAAALEDMAHREAIERLNMSYEVLGLEPASLRIFPAKQANLTVATYMTIYLLGHNFSNWTVEEIRNKEFRLFQTRRWRKIHHWIEGIHTSTVQKDHLGTSDGSLTSNETLRVVEALGEEFGHFNDEECHSLKRTLLDMEGRKPGRVRLSDFYNKSRYGVWGFAEHIDYLRILGALDESNVSNPQVIVPNYVASMPQCLRSSSVYSICCRNECEDLMATLERSIMAPEASPDRLISLVSGLSTDTVTAPRQLPDALQQRLWEVASNNGGVVPLHGRLFAQWMHHAFPRECPYPHRAGTTTPYTPDEWISETGAGDSQMTDEEMLQHIRPDDSCSIDGANLDMQELPWSYAEELLHTDEFHVSRPGAANNELESVLHRLADQSATLLFILFAVLAIANFNFFAIARKLAPEKVRAEYQNIWDSISAI